jgi:hypothetical protein
MRDRKTTAMGQIFSGEPVARKATKPREADNIDKAISGKKETDVSEQKRLNKYTNKTNSSHKIFNLSPEKRQLNSARTANKNTSSSKFPRSVHYFALFLLFHSFFFSALFINSPASSCFFCFCSLGQSAFPSLSSEASEAQP